MGWFNKSQELPKSRLEVALDHQNAALGVFQQVKDNLDVSDELLAEHTEDNSALIEQLQAENAAAVAAQEKNRKVRETVGGILA